MDTRSIYRPTGDEYYDTRRGKTEGKQICHRVNGMDLQQGIYPRKIRVFYIAPAIDSDSLGIDSKRPIRRNEDARKLIKLSFVR